MKGKKRCKILKEIRQRIADENDIAFVTSECKHKGDCLGTCPKCEAEVQYLERELAKRQALGKTVAVASLALTVTAVSSGCIRLPEEVGSGAGGGEGSEWQSSQEDIPGGMPPPSETEQLDGEMPMGAVPIGSEEIDLNGDGELMGEPLPGATDVAPVETYEELMGDVAYLPPPAFETLYGKDETEIERFLSMCIRRDLQAEWGAYRFDTHNDYDAFVFLDEKTLLIVYYDAWSYVSSVSLKHGEEGAFAPTGPSSTVPTEPAYTTSDLLIDPPDDTTFETTA